MCFSNNKMRSEGERMEAGRSDVGKAGSRAEASVPGTRQRSIGQNQSAPKIHCLARESSLCDYNIQKAESIKLSARTNEARLRCWSASAIFTNNHVRVLRATEAANSSRPLSTPHYAGTVIAMM